MPATLPTTDCQLLNVAQIGVGGYGGFRRARLRETGLFRLKAVYDINPKAIESAVKEDGAAVAESYEALLDTPGIEAVIISTGAKFHAEQITAAAERGLHIFCEKPLCSTMEEIETILEAQRKHGVVIGLGHMDHAHCAVSRTTKALIDEGELGTIAAIEKTTAHSGGFHIKPGDWRGDPAKNPGGMLFQCGVHAAHELMYYFGPISAVSACMRYDVHTTQTADVALCHLVFESGLIGTLNAYHVTAYRHTFSIYGTKASLHRNERYFEEGTLLHKQPLNPTGGPEPLEAVQLRFEDDNCGNVRSFHQAVCGGGEPYPSVRDGARAVAVVFAAEESVKNGGGFVKVPSF